MKEPSYLYMEIYKALRSEIVSGAYGYGAKLPSKRNLADKFAVSVITVMHALELLCDEGYVSAKQRSGYFVRYKSGDFMGASEITLPKPTVSAAENTEFPFSVLAKTMRRVIADYGENILLRPDNAGCPELRHAIAEYLARSKGIHANPDCIVIGSGAEYLYGLIVQLMGRDTVFAIEDPSYHQIEKVYRSNGAICRLLPLRSDGIDTNALFSTDAMVLHITPYRSFPSGVSADASKRREYISWAEKSGGIIIEDDYESEFSVSSKPVETVFSMSKGNVIYMNTFTKTLAPALRMGYMVLPPKIADLFFDRLGFYSCTVPAFEQYVVAEFIRSGDFERHINRVRRKCRKQQNLLKSD